MAALTLSEPLQHEGSGATQNEASSMSPAAEAGRDAVEASVSQTLEGHFPDPAADFQEVFVGGLPNDTTEQDVEQAFSAVGEVVCVRLNRRRKTGECKGFAFVRYKDLLTAERACRDVNKVRGEDVGVHISRPRNADPSSDTLLLAGLDSEGGINKLLNLIHTHPDRKAAIAAAIKAVMALQPRRNGHRPGGVAEGVRSGDDPDAFDDTLPDPNTFLDKFTKCKQLVERFRENPNTSNKTPLAILHEYATRLNLELQYEQNADSNLGPFTTGAKLTSVGGAVNYASGEGRGRSKKEAKQVTAAAVLENLLVTIPMDTFLQSAKKVPARMPGFMGARGVGLRGRGRGGRSASLGRYQGLEYMQAFNDYPGGQSNPFNLSLGNSSPSLQQAQSISQQDSLTGFNPAHSQRLRTYLAAQRPNELEALSNQLRGHSLDTSTANLQRQLAAGAAFTDASLGAYGSSRSFDNSGFSIGGASADAQQQQEALLRQRQAQYHQQLPSMPETMAFNNLTQNNTNLFNQQAYHNTTSSPHLTFPRY